MATICHPKQPTLIWISEPQTKFRYFLLISAIAFDNNEMPSIRISEKKNPNCNYQNTCFIIWNIALEDWNNTNMFLKFFAV